MDFQDSIEVVGKIVDSAGTAAIVGGAVVATAFAISGLTRRHADVYSSYRRFLGRSILLGLELLVAADDHRALALAKACQQRRPREIDGSEVRRLTRLSGHT